MCSFIIFVLCEWFVWLGVGHLHDATWVKTARSLMLSQFFPCSLCQWIKQPSFDSVFYVELYIIYYMFIYEVLALMDGPQSGFAFLKLQSLERYHHLSLFICQSLNLIVGNGWHIQFWTDPWSDFQSLENHFPRLINLPLRRDGPIWDFIHVSSDCNRPLRKSLRDVEMDELSSLLSGLSNISLLLFVSDRRSCALSSGGSFSIFFSFNGLPILSGHILFPHKQVWNDWTPLKVQGLV